MDCQNGGSIANYQPLSESCPAWKSWTTLVGSGSCDLARFGIKEMLDQEEEDLTSVEPNFSTHFSDKA